MRFARKHFFRSAMIFALALVGTSVFLQGCSRGGWSGHHGQWSKDPEKLEAYLAEKKEDVAERLEVKPGAQQEAFDIMADHAKEMIMRWSVVKNSALESIHNPLDPDVLDPEKAANALKELVRQKPVDQEWFDLIDKALAFYNTLDAEQQEKIQKHHRRYKRWHGS